MDYVVGYYITAVIVAAGLLITAINGVGRMFVQGKFTVLNLLAVFMLFLIHVQLLYSGWALKPPPNESGYIILDLNGSLLMIAIPLLWTIMSAILFPFKELADFDIHYFQVKTGVFFLAAINALLNGVFDTLYLGDIVFGPKNIWRVVMGAASIFLAVENFSPEKKKAWHIFILLVMIGVPFVYFMQNFSSLNP